MNDRPHRAMAVDCDLDGSESIKMSRVDWVVPGAVFTDSSQRAGLFDDATAMARLQGMAGMHVFGRGLGKPEEARH